MHTVASENCEAFMIIMHIVSPPKAKALIQNLKISYSLSFGYKFLLPNIIIPRRKCDASDGGLADEGESSRIDKTSRLASF